MELSGKEEACTIRVVCDTRELYGKVIGTQQIVIYRD
jgi:hypothetical protein